MQPQDVAPIIAQLYHSTLEVDTFFLDETGKKHIAQGVKQITGRPHVIFDASGGHGAAFKYELAQLGVPSYGVTITPGTKESGLNVGRNLLMSGYKSLLTDKRLQLNADVEFRDEWKHEMRQLEIETTDAGREKIDSSITSDLVMAVALGAFFAERRATEVMEATRGGQYLSPSWRQR